MSDHNYEHVQNVWKESGLKNLGEYHDFYLKIDVLLLSNIFETFRNTCLEDYGLSPAHFCTLPELAWQACLKFMGIRLELSTDLNMLLMFERGICGDITQAVHRYTKVSNKYTGNHEGESSFLQYLCANNLGYGSVATSWRISVG